MAKDTAAEAPTPEPATAGGNEDAGAGAEEVAAALGTPVTEVVSKAKAAADDKTAPGSKTTPPTEEPAAAEPGAKAAVDVADYEEMRAKALRPVAVQAEPEPEPEPTQPEESAGEGEQGSKEGEEEPAEEEPSKAPERIRINRLKDDADKRRLGMATQLAADEGISFDEAWTRVTGKTAAKSGDGKPETGETTEPAKPALRTPAEIAADIEALDEQQCQQVAQVNSDESS